MPEDKDLLKSIIVYVYVPRGMTSEEMTRAHEELKRLEGVIESFTQSYVTSKLRGKFDSETIVDKITVVAEE